VANGLYKRTINAVTTVTTAGTATVTIKIGSTALGGSANSASTSEQTQDHESANVMEVGDDLTIAFASTSSDCENCVVSIHATKDLS
jgi:20S proteasome alpha/beta subunit